MRLLKHLRSVQTPPTLGLRANLAQFSLLVLVNAFVGAMVGLERTILPALAEEKYHIVATTAVLSFIVVFGIVKAVTNYWAGSLSDRVGRRRVLIVGWLFAVPVPVLLMVAPTWEWILVANVFLGISQGLTWSTTVIMKIDLVGPFRRGLAMGFNEFAGYMAVAGSALATGFIAEHYGLSPEPFYLGIFYVAAGLALSIFLVRETKGFALQESSAQIAGPGSSLTGMPLFLHTTFRNRNLSTVVATGFVNNLNDGVAWGLFPILFASVGLSVGTIGWLAALYPATWGVCQLYTGYLSDRIGRKRLIVGGMIVQSLGIALTALSSQPLGFACAAILLGIGTAMVYPTLLAAIGDVADPLWRASSVGIYRFWRDAGYAVGALLAGILAQYLGVREAVVVVACITFLAGINALLRMDETLRRATEIKD
ncbi:MAG: MFS transporter [bacterium]|nr:MFS transporter [bacterium]